MTQQPHILVWGSTPLAAYLTAQWHPHHNVTWLADDAIQAAIVRHGLTLNAGGSARRVRELTIVSAMQHAKKPDIIILAMEAWQVVGALQSLLTFVPPGQTPPLLVSMQWGVGSLERIRQTFPAEEGKPDSGVVAWLPADLTWLSDAKNHISVRGSDVVLLQNNHPKSGVLAALFRAAGLSVDLQNADSIQWSGVLWGIQAQPIATILDIDPAQVYADDDLFAHEYRQILETLGIMQRLGIRPVNLPAIKLAWMATLLPRLPMSMARAWLQRQPTAPPILQRERPTGRSSAAYLNGAVAIAADRLNLETPVNHALALTLTDLAEGRALWSQYQGNPKLLLATLRLAMR